MIDMGSNPSETEPSARRSLPLNRTAQAIKRQDWSIVLLELMVVVLGVVIGFQVTVWGQARADRAKEEVYLRQLTEDFRETLAEGERAVERQRDTSHSAAAALRAYRNPEGVPLDSLARWIGGSFNFQRLAPVLGTAQGVVSSGDLSLLKDDALRAALPAYIERSREQRSSIQVTMDLYGAAFATLLGEVDALEMQLRLLPPENVDAIAERDPMFPFPAGPRRVPFPATAEDILSNPDVYGALVTAGIMSSALLEYQNGVIARAEEMLQLAEQAQDGGD